MSNPNTDQNERVSTQEREQLVKTFAHEYVRFNHDPNRCYLVTNITDDCMLEIEGMSGQFAPSCFQLAPIPVNQGEALNEAAERWDDDYGLDPRAALPTAGADGRYCRHHDDDPAHGKECYQPPEEAASEGYPQAARRLIDAWRDEWHLEPEPEMDGASFKIYESLIAHVSAATDVAATRMRDLCVAKLRETADQIEVSSRVRLDDAAVVAQYLRKAATALHSLTLEQGEQEKSEMSSKKITDRIVNKALTKVRDRKSAPIASKDKDANIIHNLFAEFHYADDLGVIKSKLVEYITAVRREARETASCTWACEPDPNIEAWETTCGNMFQLESGGPSENKMSYCCYCGGALIEAAANR